MSFSSPETTTPPAGSEGPPKKQDFEDKVGSYFQDRYPAAGGLAGMLFGNGQQPAQAQGNGLASLLKLFGI